jgi:uncharacterized protein
MRAVLDTNILISRILSPYGNPARIFQRLRDEAFELVLSEPILAEFREMMSYDRLRRLHRLSDEEIVSAAADLAATATLVEPAERLNVVPDDPDDDKFLEAAVAGEAEFVVSGDHHLLVLKTFRGIRVLTPAVFVAMLSQAETPNG